jgi:hypothetical protein
MEQNHFPRKQIALPETPDGIQITRRPRKANTSNVDQPNLAGRIVVHLQRCTTIPANESKISVKAILVPASAASTTAAAAAATAATLRGLRLGFIDRDTPAFDIRAVESGNRGIGIFLGRHFDKPEATGFAAEPVLDDAGRFYLTVGAEKLPQVVVRDIE